MRTTLASADAMTRQDLGQSSVATLFVVVLVAIAPATAVLNLGSSLRNIIDEKTEAAASLPAVRGTAAAGVLDIWSGVIEPIGRGAKGFLGRLGKGVRDAAVGAVATLRGDVEVPSPRRWPAALSGWLSRKASNFVSVIFTSIRLRAPAETLGGALADNIIELLFDPFISLGREASGRGYLADSLVRVAGSSNGAQHDLVVRALETLPEPLLQRINRYNVHFFVGTKPGDADRSRTNPLYSSMSHDIALQFWPMDRIETIYHEVGHALDNQNDTLALGLEPGSWRPQLGHYHYSSSHAFREAYDRQFPDAGDGYYDNRTANGRAEAFAESFTLWYLEPEQLDWQWPALYAYWESNPLGLSGQDHNKTLTQIEAELGMTLDDFDDAFEAAASR